MKKSEKIALEKAFGIPEPEKKNEFIEAFTEKYTETYKYNQQDRRKRFIPIIMGYASTAAIAVLVIGTWINLKDTGNMNHKPDVPIVTITTFDMPLSDVTTFDDKVTGTTGYVADKDSKTKSSKNSDSKSALFKTTETTSSGVHKSKGEAETIVQDNDDEPETSGRSSAVTTAAHHAPVTTTVRTSAHRTTAVTHTAATTRRSGLTTTKPNGKMPQTTTAAKGTMFIFTTTTGGTMSNIPSTQATTAPAPCDKTVSPDVTYNSDGEVYLVPYIDDGGNAPMPSQSGVYYSDNIAVCEVVDKIYTSYNYACYTQYDVIVKKKYSDDGSLNNGDRISIYIEGGVMPSQFFRLIYDYNSEIPDGMMVKYMNGNEAEINVGEEYLFILVDGRRVVPEGAYTISDTTATAVFAETPDGFVSLEDPDIYAYP